MISPTKISSASGMIITWSDSHAVPPQGVPPLAAGLQRACVVHGAKSKHPTGKALRLGRCNYYEELALTRTHKARNNTHYHSFQYAQL